MSALVPLCVGWALLATGFSAVALARLLRPGGAVPRTRVPVLLLRPVDAPTARELESLGRPIDYAGPLEHVVVSPYRPRLAPGVRWLPSDPPTPNRKVGHLLYALEVLRLEGRVVLAVDADVAVTGALVEGLVGSLLAGAALSTAAPVPVEARGPVGRAVAGLLRRTHHSFRALHVMSAGARPVCGKAMGLSPTALAELAGLAEHIGEDLELARRLHARGLDVALSEAPALVPLEAVDSWRAALARFSRWMRVLASHRPGLFPTVPLLFSPTWPLLVLGPLLRSIEVVLATAALVGTRALLSWRLTVLSAPQDLGRGEAPERGSGAQDPMRPGLTASRAERREGLWSALTGWLGGEALLLAAFLASLWRLRTVTWRGRTYSLRPGGRMSPVWPEPGGPE